MLHKEWPALCPLLQSALNNSSSPQRKHFAPLTIFTGMHRKTPLSSFKRPSTGEIASLEQMQVSRLLNVTKVKKLMDEIHPIVAVSLETERKRVREVASKAKLPHFDIGDYFLVARENFGAND